MKRILSIIVLGIAIAGCPPSTCTSALPGSSLPGKLHGTNHVKNQQVARRVVSLKPNITEILFAVGAGNRVVGVTTWCNEPQAAKGLPKVADYLRPFPEQLLAIHPDLVIGSEENSVKDATLQLQKLGLNTAFFSFKTMNDLFQSIQGIGDLVGHPKEAAQLVAHMQQQLAALSQVAPRRALIVVGYRPLIVVGSKSFLGEVLEIAGVQNILKTASLPYPHLNTETLLTLNPDIIIDITMGTERSQEFWKQFPMLTAVKNRQIITLNMDDFRPGPRLPEAVGKLARQL